MHCDDFYTLFLQIFEKCIFMVINWSS